MSLMQVLTPKHSPTAPHCSDLEYIFLTILTKTGLSQACFFSPKLQPDHRAIFLWVIIKVYYVIDEAMKTL